MIVVKGNKTVEISKTELLDLIGGKNVVVDLGTGDGRFVYKKASKNSEEFFIGIDPSKKQLEKFSKKANKDRLKNVLFVVGAVEQIPEEIVGMADKVFVNFPWGSLLGGIATADEIIVGNISSLLNENGELEIIFGYTKDAEPTEFERLGLETINEDYIRGKIVPEFEKQGLKLQEVKILGRDSLFEIESNWGKKLKFGKSRDFFRMTMKK